MGKMDMFEKRGYAGIVGALMALIGFFMPVVELGMFGSYSTYDYLSDEAPLMCILYIAVLVGIGIAYTCIRHKVAFILSIPCAIYFFFVFFGEGGFSDMSYLGIGFWVSAIGVLLTILSPWISESFIE